MEWYESLRLWLLEVIDWVEANPESLLWALMLFAFVESFAMLGVLIPGIAVLAVLGTLAASSDVNIWVALVLVYLGAVLGDGISFALGYTLREKIHGWKFFRDRPDWLPRASKYFRRLGVPALVVGRFVGPLRPVLPISAGILGLSPRLFMLINLLTATGWSATIILPAYKLNDYLQVGNYTGALVLVAAVVVVIGVVLWLFSRMRIDDD